MIGTIVVEKADIDLATESRHAQTISDSIKRFFGSEECASVTELKIANFFQHAYMSWNRILSIVLVSRSKRGM